MAWTYLFLAGILEILWAIGLKQSAGFTRLGPSVFTLAALAASFALLGLALRTLPLGTAYAIWTGLGTLGTVAFGIWAWGEPASAVRLLSIGAILAGIIGLKLTAPG